MKGVKTPGAGRRRKAPKIEDPAAPPPETASDAQVRPENASDAQPAPPPVPQRKDPPPVVHDSWDRFIVEDVAPAKADPRDADPLVDFKFNSSFLPSEPQAGAPAGSNGDGGTGNGNADGSEPDDANSPFPTEDEYAQGAAVAEAAREESIDLLCFAVAGEEFAIDIHRVWEIIRPRPVTELPGVAGFISGIISLRGEIVPVLDLRRRLGFPAPAEPPASSKIVVAIDEGRYVGLTVDAVAHKVRVPVSGITAPSTLLGAQESGFLRGVCRHDGRLLAVLNADAVLDFDAEARGAREGAS